MGFQSGVKAKRSLGQNFFINEDLIKKIVDIVKESHPNHITEIGAGKGAFTAQFYDTTQKMTLVEIDFTLYQILISRFPNLEIYNQDFIEYELNNSQTTYFGSLPFNKYGEIIEKILKSKTFTNPAFFIVQKEVAEKYLNKETNQLGLISQIYADCKKHFDIKPGNFKPRPNVTSSFISFKPHSKYPNVDKDGLEKLIERAFKQPRKILQNNLKGYHYNLDESLKKLRPNQLEIDDYISILKDS